jgi:hypothetical protein
MKLKLDDITQKIIERLFPFSKYNLPQFIDYIIEKIRTSPNNKNNNDYVYDSIIDYININYNLKYSDGEYIEISPIKNEGLKYIVSIFKDEKLFFLFYERIKIIYINNTGRRAGENVGGLTRNFFFECQEQLHELFKDFISNNTFSENNRFKMRNNITEKPENFNDNLTQFEYYKYFNNYILLIYLLIFSKINNCPIYLDKELFHKLSKIILYLIIISDEYSLIQKIFIINILQKYKDIVSKSLPYGMYGLLLTQKHTNNMVNNGIFHKKNVINTYIKPLIEKNKNNPNQKNLNKNMEELKKSINKNTNLHEVGELIKDAIRKGIYKNFVDFYYTHLIPHTVTFEAFMKNLKFHKKSIYSREQGNIFVRNNEVFIEKIKKLLNYMNKKDDKNILLLSQAMSGNTLLAPEYTINLYPGKSKYIAFHTCFNSVDFYEDNFPYEITENENGNQDGFKKFMEDINLAIQGNFDV